MTPPEITPDCCEVWPKILTRFQWHTFKVWPSLATMPFIPDSDNDCQWRVNHCPSCGANQRDAVRLANEVQR